MLMLTLLTGCAKTDKKEKSPDTKPEINGISTTLAKAVYPTSVPYPNEADYGDDWVAFSDAYDTWWEGERALRDIETDDRGIDGYVKSLTKTLLKDNGKNKAMSPANIYFALALLANVSDGNTRTQVLDTLGYDSVEELNKNSKKLWEKLYKNNGISTSVLANSLWTSDEYSYNQDTVNKLKDELYASSFTGDFADPAYSQALRDWINEQTGGLLKEQSKGVGFSDETVFALASTIYFKAQWQDKFHKLNTKTKTFHGTHGDTEADFMHSGFSRNYYYTDSFCATDAYLEGGGSMYFILPDKDIASVLEDDAFYSFIADPSGTDKKYLPVNLSLPKFDVAYDKNISDELQAMGITDAFDDSKADFSQLVTGIPMELTSVNHAARVKIDEEGCEAAAYTVMTVDGTAAPPKDEVDMVLDRPFIFVVTGEDGLPRFIGTVNNI